MPVRSFHFIVAMVAGWLQREQEATIEYLKEIEVRRLEMSECRLLAGRKGQLEVGESDREKISNALVIFDDKYLDSGAH